MSTDPFFWDEMQVTVPTELQNWLFNWGTAHGNSTTVTVGDIEGADDGDLNIVIYNSNEAALAARLDIDWGTKSVTVTPLWFWLSPYALDSANGGLAGSPPTPNQRSGTELTGPIIHDFDGDGENEVLLHAQDYRRISGTYAWRDSLYVLSNPTIAGGYPAGSGSSSNGTQAWSGTSIAQPTVYTIPGGDTFTGEQNRGLGNRAGVCNVSDATDDPRDIVSHTHDADTCGVWRFEDNGTTKEIVLLYAFDYYGTKTELPTGYTVSDRRPTHEFNWLDSDGDGFDEFFIDGELDFVDADVNGDPDPINQAHPKAGRQVWITQQMTSNTGPLHVDQMFAARWDVASAPGELQALGVPEYQKDTLYRLRDASAPRGAPTSADENTASPVVHGQGIASGNFSVGNDGLEALFFPKEQVANPVVVPPSPTGVGGVDAGGYLTNVTGEDLLAIDGTVFYYWDPGSGEPYKRVSTGPSRRALPIDFDGDYSRDEAVSNPWDALIVWACGYKGDGLPSYFPTPTQIENLSAPYPDAYSPYDPLNPSDDEWHFFYHGKDGSERLTWGWNNGGPGRGWHFWEKLAETWPHGNRPNPFVYDLGNDHREEVLAPTPDGLYILFNEEAYSGSPRMSPTRFLEYRLWRQDVMNPPFVYQDLPEIAELRITPETSGLDFASTRQMAATIVLSNGGTVDVTDLVSWSVDRQGLATISSAGILASKSLNGAVRVNASIDLGDSLVGLGGGSLEAEPAYVMCTSATKPVVILAGYSTTRLESGVSGSVLRVEARVAQRDGDAVVVEATNADGTPWDPLGTGTLTLLDDGGSASGDDVAGDGIYTASIVLTPTGGQNGLVLGDNLKGVRAYLAATPSNISKAWPYLTIGATQTWFDITGPCVGLGSENDGLADADVPHIRQAGFRAIPGIRGASTILFVEAVVDRPTSDSDAALTVIADFTSVIGGITFPVVLTESTPGVFSYFGITPPAAANGSYLVGIRATTPDPLLGDSDCWPRLRIHQ
ncbi:hypothetical protein [Planctomycetes bacterium Pla163]|uniref:hypothetical protein n=1 Tax=Rohdeia mirabilis TaxID=2528008 RepID=UPI00119E032B